MFFILRNMTSLVSSACTFPFPNKQDGESSAWASLWRLFLRLHVFLEGFDFLCDVWNLWWRDNNKTLRLNKRSGKKQELEIF